MFFVYFHSENVSVEEQQHQTGCSPDCDLNQLNPQRASYNSPAPVRSGGAREGMVVDKSREVQGEWLVLGEIEHGVRCYVSWNARGHS